MEILELRLEILGPTVDYFIIGEADRTFTGQPKPFLYEENRSKFSKYSDKIIHVKIKDSPKPLARNMCWNVEYFQRNALIRGLKGKANTDDYIILADADEIVNPHCIPQAIAMNRWTSFELDLYYYYFNIKANQKGLGPVLARYGSFRNMQQLRYSVNRNPKISNGGWHFSFMGGANKIIEKLNAYAETQTNSEEINRQNVINYKIANGYDLFNRADLKYEIVEIDQLYPLEVISFLNKYPSFHLTADKLEEYKQIKIEGLNLSKNYTKRSVLFRLLKKIYKLYLRFL